MISYSYGVAPKKILILAADITSSSDLPFRKTKRVLSGWAPPSTAWCTDYRGGGGVEVKIGAKLAVWYAESTIMPSNTGAGVSSSYFLIEIGLKGTVRRD
jgi:hypothetical protein